jgi:hypothetical protein
MVRNFTPLYGFESITRPFSLVQSAGPQALPQRRQLFGEDAEACITWGSASRFLRSDQTEPSRTSGGFSFTTNKRDPEDEPESEDGERIYREVARTVSVIRVENPSDASQFVDVERIETIDFTAPDGGTVRFVLNHA